MRKNRLFAVITVASAVWLGGCYRFTHFAGPPCMGNACPTGTKGEPPAAVRADYQKPPADPQAATNAPAPAEPAPAAANSVQGNAAQSNAAQQNSAQAKPGRFTRLLETLHLHSKS